MARGLGNYADRLKEIPHFAFDRQENDSTRDILLKEKRRGEFVPTALPYFKNLIKREILPEAELEYVLSCISSFESKWDHSEELDYEEMTRDLIASTKKAEDFILELKDKMD